MGHGWHAGTTEKTRDPYNKLYHYFKSCKGATCSAPPMAEKTQISHKDKTSPVHHPGTELISFSTKSSVTTKGMTELMMDVVVG